MCRLCLSVADYAYHHKKKFGGVSFHLLCKSVTIICQEIPFAAIFNNLLKIIDGLCM